jgi:hypothetical protein
VPVAGRRAVRATQFAAAGRGGLVMLVHEVLPLKQAGLAHQKRTPERCSAGSCSCLRILGLGRFDVASP